VLTVAQPRATPREVDMSILAWMVLGLIAGFIGSKIVNKTGEGFVLDIVLGIVGAIVGGYLFNLFGASGVTGVNIYSLFVTPSAVRRDSIRCCVGDHIHVATKGQDGSSTSTNLSAD
jgi:uncharacterized membrane protein YeaQ/YmgE (transglycosylase-associated protein family)